MDAVPDRFRLWTTLWKTSGKALQPPVVIEDGWTGRVSRHRQDLYKSIAYVHTSALPKHMGPETRMKSG
jgi:hypothetical protein